MLQRHTPCRYVITLRYAFLQRYMEAGYFPLYIILLTLGFINGLQMTKEILGMVDDAFTSLISNLVHF